MENRTSIQNELWFRHNKETEGILHKFPEKSTSNGKKELGMALFRFRIDADESLNQGAE